MLSALAGLSVAPFGDHTLLITDANGYYINTLSYAARMYKGLEGITYSFEKTIGGNMMGHLNGILLTPFAFLLSLVDITKYPSAFSFISVLNFSLCGLTMYLLLADQYGHKSSHLIFSTSYALMGFNVANVFQAVFFCAAPVLPIMALGLKKLMQGKSPLLYILSIAYGMLSNTYFGFVLCVASFLFFFAELIASGDSLSGKRLRIFLHYAISSICGGLLPIILWLPAFLSLQGGRLEQTKITDFTFVERQPLLDIGSKLFSGANSTSQLVYGLPNIFVGLLPVALVILFFMNKKIEKRKKMAAGILLGIYLLCFSITAFDMVMHGGTSPNWFNFRYSYVFSFLMLVIAAAQWEYIEETPYADMRRTFVIMVLATVVIFSKRYEFVYGGEVLLDYTLLLLVFLAFRMHRNKPENNPKSTFELIALILVCISLFVNYRICTKNIREWETKASDFKKTVVAVDPMVQAVKTTDQSFYRMEINRQRSRTTGNDPMLYGYNGVGHGGSNERDFVRTELFKLGIPWYSNRSYYADGVTPATDNLLGLKYIIAEEDLAEEKGYTKKVGIEDWNLYENADALSIALLSDSEIDEVENDLTSVFQNLNKTWAAITGSDKQVFTEVDEIQFRSINMSDPIEISSSVAREAMEELDRKAESTEQEESETSDSLRRRTDAPDGCAYIEYTWIAEQDGSVYVYERNGVTDLTGSGEPVVSWLGNYSAGDTVTGYISTTLSAISKDVMEELCGRFRAAYADDEVLHELSEVVRSRPVTIDKVRDNHLVGSFTAEEDQELLFTIPWDDGWSLTVDGQMTELHKVVGLFMAASVPAGTHQYEMRFTPVGLHTGMIISCVALLFTLAYLLIGRKSIDQSIENRAARKAEAVLEVSNQVSQNEESVNDSV